MGAAAQFNMLQGVTVDSNNNILVADNNQMISGANTRVTTVAGNVEVGAVDSTSARFNGPMHLVLDDVGCLLVLVWNTNCLRVVEVLLMSPLLLAPKVLPDVQDPLREDLSKLLDLTALFAVTANWMYRTP